MAVGGTTCGLEEEAVAFYPILVPIFLALGYDSIVCVGAIFLAASMGTTFSTINPFSVVIASNAAGIVFTEGILWRTFGLVVGTATVIGYLYWYCKRLKADPALSAAFDALTPGRRRGWVLHVLTARQPATRHARIDKAAPRILAGKGMHDRP